MPDIVKLLLADGTDFVSRPVEALTLTLYGIDNDRHAGPKRTADARTPWHPRGARIANTRQLSLVSLEECDEVARLLGIDEVDPALLGANVVVAGLPELSLMQPATRLQGPSGATIFITEQNAPCRYPGERLAAANRRPEIASRFARAAIGRRGIVGLVEREGVLRVGDPLRVHPSPAQVAAPKFFAIPLPSA